ncbi:MAG: PD40 domain-containing protein [Planctomycetes bacterium]|nr:PD40 domain-containing protein [Planctomycetota bacterium]
MIAQVLAAALAAAGPEPAERLAVDSGVYLQEIAEVFDAAPAECPVFAPAAPFPPVRAAVADARGIWFATDRGIYRVPRQGGRSRYYAGRRWLPDDRVEAIAAGGGAIWARTPSGVARIAALPYTLERKAQDFERRIRARHLRHGFVASSALATPGDLSTSRTYPNDNDGLWTAMYIAAESFRFAVTRDPEAARFARESFRALLRLQEVTGIPGFPARSFVAKGEPTGGGEWHPTADGEWIWKGDTSSDEIDGHFFALGIFHDLVADETERRAAADAARAIADHIIRNGFTLVDLDGKPTRWGVWAPEKLNGDPSWWCEKGLNSLEILSTLAVTERLTGDAKYRAVARDLIEKHGYARNAIRQKITDPPEEINHSDDELAYLAYYNLLRCEGDPALRALYHESLHLTWKAEGPERNPLWTFIHASSGIPDATRDDIEAAIDTLRRTPMDLRTWTMVNSHRLDIARASHRSRFRAALAAEPLLPEERGGLKYNSDPYRLDDGGGGGEEDDGAFFLLAYWMGRYHGFLRQTPPAAGSAPDPHPTWIDRDPWLCPDGYTVLFSSNRGGGDFDIFETQWDGKSWSEPTPLGPHVNSDFDETLPSVSADGRGLLFVSHRGRFWRGPWISRRQPDGSWGRAEFIDNDVQPEVRRARIGPDGRTIYFQRIAKGAPPDPRVYDLRMPYDPARRFWERPRPFAGDPPDAPIPGSIPPLSIPADPGRGDRPEALIAVDASSARGAEDDDQWTSEAQNLVDGLEDTSWISREGAPLDAQWVLLRLGSRIKYVPGLSRIHSLRIRMGSIDAGSASRPVRLRILGGFDRDALAELAVTDLGRGADPPWREIRLGEPAWLRYLRIEVLEASDPRAPCVAFDEVEAYGAGLSGRRPGNRVSKDANNNITVDGRPFFPIYIYNAKSDSRLAEWGFNTALQTYDVDADTQRIAILDRAEDEGFMVIGHIPWVETESGRKQARNQLLALKDHPALLGYLMSDEAGHDEETMKKDERRADLIRKYDPNHFTMLNDLYPQTYPRSSRFVDVFSIDPYPHIVGQPYAYQGFAVDAAYRAVAGAKPVFVVNASWGFIITPLENRLNVYLALIHGAKGISWYELGVRQDHPDHWESIRRCIGEIRRLEPVLFAPDPAPDSPLRTHSRIENPGTRIDALIRQVGGEVWLIAANTEPRESRVRLSLGWAERIVIRETMADRPEVWSLDRGDLTLMDAWPPPEDREPVREARPIDLVFGPYQVRIFRMAPSGPIGPIHEPRIESAPLAVVNESIRARVVEEVKRLRDGGEPDEAKATIDRFWTKCGDRLSGDDLAALIDQLAEDAKPEAILADYGRLADAYPRAEGWPKWVFEIIRAMVRAGRPPEARAWMDRLVEARPDSIWRANAEVLVDPASAASGRKPWTRAARIREEPVIDGELDEPVWRDRVTFASTVYLDASKRPQPTEFAVAYSDEALFVAARAIEPEISKIRMRFEKDDDDRSIWADDCIVLYFDPGLDYFEYEQLIFNAAGAKWDGRADRLGRCGAGRLNANVRREARVKGDAWQIEARIPFAELRVERPAPGRVWGLGVQRWRHVSGALPTVWGNARGTSHDNRPEGFGFLVFE